METSPMHAGKDKYIELKASIQKEGELFLIFTVIAVYYIIQTKSPS